MSNLTKAFAADDSSDGDNLQSGSQTPVSTTASKDTAKRRPSRAGTRSVSTLTAAQLERKRANDREAQRAIRQRTKDHIDRLERRIAELSANKDAQQKLDNVLQRNEELEEEVTALRSRLDMAAAALGYQPDAEELMGSSSVAGAATQPISMPNNFGLTTATVPDNLFITPSSKNDSVHSTPSPQWARPSMPRSSVSSSESGIEVMGWPTDAPMDTGLMSPSLTPNIDSIIPPVLNFQFLLNANNETLDFKRDVETRTPRKYDADAVTSGLFASGSAMTTSMYSSAAGDTSMASTFSGAPSLYAWEFSIRNIPATCPLDHVLLNYIQNQRSFALGGSSAKALASASAKMSPFGTMRDTNWSVMPQPISKALTDVLYTIPQLDSIPEKVAVLFMMYLLLRWQVVPSPQTYDALPDWLTPRPSQLATPHAIWIDQVPWPKLRDRLIHNQNLYGTLEFLEIFIDSLSVNWPYRPMDTLCCQRVEDLAGQVTDQVLINPVFERHLNRLESWSLGPRFQTRYPELHDCCNFTPLVDFTTVRATVAPI